MGTIKPIEKCDDDRVKRQIEKENDTFNKIKRWLFLGCASAFVVFLIHRPLGIWSSPIDEDLLETYGDFVGGVIGTLITLYSVYLLVKTLNNQIEVNSNIVKTNVETLNAAKQQIKQTDLNLFDSKFNAYLKAYQDAINGYTSSDCSEKECLDAIITEFRSSGFKNEVQYLGRTQAAVKEFEGLYAKNRTVMSTHLRTLFLLMQLIADKGNIENEDRVAYAKCIRGQLSEGEMFVIRYNCYTGYGHNMQKYVNRYNLLKHLPTMSLLEFNKWRSIVETHPGYVNTIDAFFQRLRKEIGELLLSTEENEGENKIREIQVSKDYTVFVEFADENKYYCFKLLRFCRIAVMDMQANRILIRL